DNRHLAYSAWQRGGFRDVRIVDTFDGSYVQITRDRAVDGGPSYAPDGKTLFFHSDRTGVMNVFAYDVATGALAQVTNVRNGAYQPQVSPDGKTLAYLGYTHEGFDLFAMDLDPSRYLAAPVYVDERPKAPDEPARTVHIAEPYNPLVTLRPRAYSVSTAPGNFGQSITVSARGADVAGFHAVGITLRTEVDKPELQPTFAYTYGRLPVDLSLRAYRSIAPATGFAIGSYQPRWTQEHAVLETSASYALPRPFSGQYFNLSYSADRIAGDIPFPENKIDPYETPSIPTRGLMTMLSLSWSYSNAQSYLWSVSPEKGFSLSANVSVTHPALASDFSGFAATFQASVYQRMPWLRHHVLALHGSGGTSGGNYPGRSLFYVGGYVDLPLVPPEPWRAST
ncbi:hypothetical protein EON77_15295, partial [bacterium]